jgi:hypothetical protein
MLRRLREIVAAPFLVILMIICGDPFGPRR